MQRRAGEIAKVEDTTEPGVILLGDMNIVLEIHQVRIVKECLVKHLEEDAAACKRKKQPIELAKDLTALFVAHFFLRNDRGGARMINMVLARRILFIGTHHGGLFGLDGRPRHSGWEVRASPR